METHPLQSQKTTRKIRLASIATAILVLIWLPQEDTHLAWVLILALLIASLLTIALLTWLIPKTHPPDWTLMVLGALGGSLVGILCITLMAIKTGLHGHGTPDFTTSQMQAVLASTPLWCLIGALAGGITAWLRRKG